jgi:glycosyltransferase involved in cell wall biosynthesis
MACGVPVVASRVGGLPDVIKDQVTGFVCDPDDIDLMASCACELLTNTQRRSEIAAAAIADVRGRFSVDFVVPQYEAFYEEVLAR